MVKAIFFDIDGTLVSFETHKIPASTQEALKALRDKGIKIFIATGRPQCLINNLSDLEFDGYITVNGSYCFTAATMLTRFLPFLIFSSKEQQPPEVVRYLGRVLPAAIFGMLIVYCLKGVTPFSGSHGIPEALALLATIALHKWKHQTLLSVAGGTLCYVLLVQLVF